MRFLKEFGGTSEGGIDIHKHFISIMRPGPNVRSERHDDLIEQHCRYLRKFFEEGIVIFAGPSWEDNEDHFAIVVLETENKEKAMEIMDNNPVVVEKVLTSKVTEFNVFLDRCM